MLKGVHYPLTPKGKSILNPLPPWHYSADFLNLEFWTDPSVVAATLPSGLDPVPSADGHANALFYDWQFSDHLSRHSDEKVKHMMRGCRLPTDSDSYQCGGS